MNNRVVIDSSIWISAHRNPGSAVADELRRLMRADLAVGVGPVLTELLSGTRSHRIKDQITAGFAVITYVEADDRTWKMAGGIGRQLRDANQMIGFADTIIAALSIQHGLALYTLDRDFELVDGLRLHRVGGSVPS